MTLSNLRPAALSLGLALLCTGAADAQAPKTLLGAPCTATTNAPVTESRTDRTYLLDYPCDLRDGEDVTFILNLHGGGSSGNWQRRYFPAFDQKERHRLVVASPYSPIRRWTEDDDAYLQNIVTSIVSEIGADNIRAFWLAGHSQGGATSRRIVCTPFFASRVDGFLSLSGGRLGGAAPRAPNAGRPVQRDAAPAPAPAPAPAAAPAAATPAEPTCDFSHIFAIGQHEIVSLPATSSWATRFGCDARQQRPDVVDTQPGYVHDGGNQNPGSREWGLLPRPGSANVFVYPGCDDGRVVADVVRLDKGHTEGLEPAVTEALVAMMVSASGGKIARSATQAAAPVDYRDGANWLCRPGRQDACAVDLTTTVVRADGTMAREEWRADPNAAIDCFYVYPTVSTDPGMNSDMTPNEAELRVIYQQFARFGSVCRTYAPSYRQVTLAGLRERRAGGATNLDQGLAYSDVLGAFRHYLEHDNAGRGFVLIGHSQGAAVLRALIAAEIDGKDTQQRMVSAYLLGQTFTVARGQDVGGAFRSIPLCRTSSQIGCVVTYASYRSTSPPPADALFGRESDPDLSAACVNPAALGGGSGELHAYLSGPGYTIVSGRGGGPAWATGAQIATPFVSVPGLLSARCTSNEHAAYLEVTVHGNPSDPRADDIRGDLTPQWGLHLVDMNVAMGNLVDLVRAQSTSYRAR